MGAQGKEWDSEKNGMEKKRRRVKSVRMGKERGAQGGGVGCWDIIGEGRVRMLGKGEGRA